MSNIIKSHYIFVDRDEKKVIDSDLKAKTCYPEIFEEHREEMAATSEFVAGLYAIPVEERVIQNKTQVEETIEEEQASLLREEIIENAKKEAEDMIETAKREAKVFACQIEEEARRKGYNEGIEKGNQEILKKQEEMTKREEQLELDYQNKITQLEPAFVELTAALLEKLTGVIMKERKEVIVHLMKHSLRQLSRVNMISIRVSKQDVIFVDERKEELEDMLSYPCEINIMEDSTLSKGECIIETDKNMIDCSLDTQLASLIEELKMLGNKKE